MGSIDAGSMCCCVDETFTVFGPRYNDSTWDEYKEDESPVHLLGTVYYATGNLLNTATTVGKYAITDSLDDSSKNWSPPAYGLPVVQHTVTPWGGGTLYSVSYTTGAVQKAGLSEAVAKWWYEPPDSDEWEDGDAKSEDKGFFPYGKFVSPPKEIGGDHSAYVSNVICTHGRLFKGDPHQPRGGGWQELGLNLPTGPGWDSECGNSFCASRAGSEPAYCLENPRGEFVRYTDGKGLKRFYLHRSNVPGHEVSPWPWDFSKKNQAGFSDDGFGAVCPYEVSKALATDSRKRGGKVLPENEKDTGTGLLTTLSSVKIDSNGVGVVASPGNEVQWGWGPTQCAANCSALDSSSASEVMTDSDFCATGNNTKVIPAKVAANNWPNGAGGFAEVDPGGLSSATETNVLAVVRWEEAKKMVGSAAMPVDDYWDFNNLPSQEPKLPVYVWPPRVQLHYNNELEVREGQSCLIIDSVKLLDTCGEVSQKILDALDDKSECKDHTGNSATKGDEGSTFTAFDKEDIANYMRLYSVPRGHITNPLYGDFAEDGDGIPVGFWVIKRKVGVNKFTYTSRLVPGEIQVVNGKMPYISIPKDVVEGVEVLGEDVKALFSSDYYWTLPGITLPDIVDLTVEKLTNTTCGQYPWSYLEDFVAPTDKKLAYMTRKRVTASKSGGADWTPPHQANPLKTDYVDLPTSTGLVLGCRSHVMKGSVYYYNETEGGKEVYVISRESVWEGLDAPQFYDNFTGDGRIDYAVDSSYVAPTVNATHYTEENESPPCGKAGEISGASLDWSGFSISYKLKPNNTDTLGVKTKQGGYYKLGRWEAGGDSSEGAVDTAHGLNNYYDFHLSKGAHYTHSQLLFNGHLIWDEFKEENGFVQTKEDGPLLNTHLPAHGTARAKKLTYPRTLLDGVEVLVGDRIAVFTTKVSDPSSAPTGGGQTLSVFNDEGEKLWSIQSPQDVIRHENTPGAVVVASSDRWIHVMGFPLNVREHTDKEVPAAGQKIEQPNRKPLDEDLFSSWLFSYDGKKKVPARLDEKNRVVTIDDYTDLSTASWADFRRKLGGTEAGEVGARNYDAARTSTVIDTVKPGTMHPDEFF